MHHVWQIPAAAAAGGAGGNRNSLYIRSNSSLLRSSYNHQELLAPAYFHWCVFSAAWWCLDHWRKSTEACKTFGSMGARHKGHVLSVYRCASRCPVIREAHSPQYRAQSRTLGCLCTLISHHHPQFCGQGSASQLYL